MISLFLIGPNGRVETYFTHPCDSNIHLPFNWDASSYEHVKGLMTLARCVPHDEFVEAWWSAHEVPHCIRILQNMVTTQNVPPSLYTSQGTCWRCVFIISFAGNIHRLFNVYLKKQADAQ